MNPALQTDREKLEEEIRTHVEIFNEGDPQQVLESIKRIRELRSRLRIHTLDTVTKEATP